MKDRSVLIVEDNPADALLMREALHEAAGKEIEIRILNHPDKAVEFIRDHDGRPDLIVLDYRMPTNGGAALSALKADPELCHIPIIVMTGKVSKEELCQVYGTGANCCFVKPSNLDQHFGLFKHITDLWLKQALLPKDC
jgi:CheY-like chemotaxis protein